MSTFAEFDPRSAADMCRLIVGSGLIRQAQDDRRTARAQKLWEADATAREIRRAAEWSQTFLNRYGHAAGVRGRP